jgi:hypothetical protein
MGAIGDCFGVSIGLRQKDNSVAAEARQCLYCNTLQYSIEAYFRPHHNAV